MGTVFNYIECINVCMYNINILYIPMYTQNIPLSSIPLISSCTTVHIHALPNDSVHGDYS